MQKAIQTHGAGPPKLPPKIALPMQFEANNFNGDSLHAA